PTLFRSQDRPDDLELAQVLFGRAQEDLARSGALSPSGDGFRLDLRSTRVETVSRAYLCPVTRRVLGRTLLGISPYQTERWTSTAKCEVVEMPKPKFVYRRDGLRDVSDDEIREWLTTDPQIASLRNRGIWTEFSD